MTGAEYIQRIEAGSARLYERDFLGLMWLATYVADVDSLCTLYEDLQQKCAALDAVTTTEGVR